MIHVGAQLCEFRLDAAQQPGSIGGQRVAWTGLPVGRKSGRQGDQLTAAPSGANRVDPSFEGANGGLRSNVGAANLRPDGTDEQWDQQQEADGCPPCQLAEQFGGEQRLRQSAHVALGQQQECRSQQGEWRRGEQEIDSPKLPRCFGQLQGHEPKQIVDYKQR